MSIDGVFLHHLTKELHTSLQFARIQRIYQVRQTDFVFSLSNKKVLYFALGDAYPNVRISKLDFTKDFAPSSFVMLLRKYLERGVITDIKQYQNDRVLMFHIQQKDELGYQHMRILIVELITRYTNFIITDENYTILDVFKKTPIDAKRILLPKMRYPFLVSEQESPFLLQPNSRYQGVGKLLQQEIQAYGLQDVISRNTTPTKFIQENTTLFYAFDLKTIQAERITYPTLSDMLEEYFLEKSNQQAEDTYKKGILSFLVSQRKKAIKKLDKQTEELQNADTFLSYEKYGNLLSSNLHKVKKGDHLLCVEDFYDDYQPITLELDPLLSPSKNLQNFYAKYKKATRSISQIQEQLRNTKQEIAYIDTLIHQVKIGNDLDIGEIKEEIGYKVSKQKRPNKKKPPNYLVFTYQNDQIYVGKNNVQNNYLTHVLANREDYFFHVKNLPGSHVIVKSNDLSNETIDLAAQLCAYYSKISNDTKVSVDYTKVKFVRRIKGQPGSFVNYTNFKTITIQTNAAFVLEKIQK